MIKKICSFLSHPLVNIFVGLIFLVLIGIWIVSLGEAFDSLSAFCGGLAVISLDIMFYGINFYIDKHVSKNSPQDLDEEN